MGIEEKLPYYLERQIERFKEDIKPYNERITAVALRATPIMIECIDENGNIAQKPDIDPYSKKILKMISEESDDYLKKKYPELMEYREKMEKNNNL